MRWVEQRRPSVGWVAYMRRRTRADYHKAIKAIKTNKDKIIREKVAQSLSNSNHNQFWKNINKLKPSTKTANNVIDGKCGINACNIFKDKYEKLYNTVPRDVELGGLVLEVNEHITC